MYLSHLLIAVGDNPDRPRPGRLWLRNIYRVHQRLCMAFPSKDRKDADGHFLAPYKPEDFPEDRYLAVKEKDNNNEELLKQVHSKRYDSSGFLFRIDPHPGGNVSILVLSAREPDWDYAFHNADYLLEVPPSAPRPLDIHIEPGVKFRFKLKANPTRRLSKNSEFPKKTKKKGETVRVKVSSEWIGKRVPVPYEELDKWLDRHGSERGGFKTIGNVEKNTGYMYFKKPNSGKDENNRLFSVDFSGVLEVTDDCSFRNALLSGIGPAKAFGFGLLTIAPI